MPRPGFIRIVEVGPRDGLQNEATAIATNVKTEFIARLVAAGLREIEATAFVHPDRVPQLADAVELAARLPVSPGVRFSALVPNERGLQRCRQTNIGRICVFTGASETFVRRNINMTIDESLATFGDLARAALASGLSVRGYLSTAFVCPYEGEIATDAVVRVARELHGIGCDEIAISDTIGAAGPDDIVRVVAAVADVIPLRQIALHLHDTYGTAVANVVAGLDMGVATFDASAGGLGGCPYAAGASGNLATEDLLYLLDRLGIEHDGELEQVAGATDVIAAHLGRRLPSRNWQRLRPV